MGPLPEVRRRLTYTPNLNWSGSDSFEYVVNDGLADSELARVTIAVSPVDDPPSAPVLTAVAGDKQVVLSWTASVDVDSASITYELRRSIAGAGYVSLDTVSGTAYADSGLQNGVAYAYYLTAQADGVSSLPSNVVTATPTVPDYNAYVIANPAGTAGTVAGDYTLTRVGDGQSQVLTEAKVGQNGMLDVTYTLKTTAARSQITSLTLVLDANYPVGDPLKVSILSGGTWLDITEEIIPGGIYDASPASCVDLSGFIQVRLTDTERVRREALDQFDIDELMAEISIGTPMNSAPIANNDTASTPEATAVTIAVLDNDSDPDLDRLTVAIASAPAHGIANVSGDKILYSPNAGFVGTDLFTYSVSDGRGGSDTATVTVSVGVKSVHVASIEVTVAPTGKSLKGTARIIVLDQANMPVLGATVTGNWSFAGSVIQTGATATTDASGEAALTSPPVKTTSGTFTFQVTSVALAGYTYDSTANVKSQGSATIP
jgi:large repetitive protein